jgi:3-dehydrosphinganine reductase
VSDASSIAKVVKESFDWRPIDVLVCNAGTLSVGQIENVSVEDLEHTTKTNLLGCVYTLHAALPLMKSRSFQNPSSILIMGSMASLVSLTHLSISHLDSIL